MDSSPAQPPGKPVCLARGILSYWATWKVPRDSVLRENLFRHKFLVAQRVKNLPAVQKTRVLFLGWEDPLEEGAATHSRIPAWKTPRTEEPAGYSPWGREESDTTEGPFSAGKWHSEDHGEDHLTHIQPWVGHCGCTPVPELPSGGGMATVLLGTKGRIFTHSVYYKADTPCESRAQRAPASTALSAPLQPPPLLHAAAVSMAKAQVPASDAKAP